MVENIYQPEICLIRGPGCPIRDGRNEQELRILDDLYCLSDPFACNHFNRNLEKLNNQINFDIIHEN